MAERTEELAVKIIEGLTNGTPLRQLCREFGVSKTFVYDWMNSDSDFDGRIARARERGYFEIADESLEIVDNLEEEHQSRKLRAEHRLKLLAKWSPNLWGDKQQVEHSGTLNMPPDARQAEIDRLLAKRHEMK